jgi:hypothetical protein
VRRWLERESLLIVVLALYAGVVTVALPQELSQDGWLALVCGREVAQHGLPSHDALNVLTMGARWTDQQWLGQLALYGLGVRGALLAHAAVVTAALAGAAAYARRAGASVNAVARVAVLVVATLGLLPMRTQTFGYALFVAVLALLCADVRRPGRRVLWVLPLLALWANVHGSVLLGAALVGLRALFGLRRAPARSLALVAVAVAGPSGVRRRRAPPPRPTTGRSCCWCGSPRATRAAWRPTSSWCWRCWRCRRRRRCATSRGSRSPR